MAVSGSNSLPTIGFFTVTEDVEWGIVGGLLVLNAAGRPLEFHCTAPLKPNRAQEILYGPTLRPFIYGEQIGAVLAAKARSDTLFLCTDVEPAMCLRSFIKTPLVLLLPSQRSPNGAAKTEAEKNYRLDSTHQASSPKFSQLSEFQLGPHPAAVLKTHESDQSSVEESWRPFATHLDLNEPFERVREALLEAQRGATK